MLLDPINTSTPTNLDSPMKPQGTEFPALTAKHKILEAHPVFSAIRNTESLRLFMSWHVFAVWDFMCLVKRLQRELASTQQVWMPPVLPLASRLINEIVLAEECDEMPDGSYKSHFELYLLAMHEVGADTGPIEQFIALLRQGESVKNALDRVPASYPVQQFVTGTMRTATHGNVYQVLGSFFFGREHVIPKMFSSLLENWSIDESDAPMFVYYLNRHIELDGDNHGPAAARIINDLTQGNEHALRQLEHSAADAIDARLRLWDGLLEAMTLKPSGDQRRTARLPCRRITGSTFTTRQGT